MTAKPVAHLLADLGVTKSHSRPHVSNDNPYSESHFRTLNTGRASRSASGRSRTPTPTAAGSSVGTTTTTGTRASGSTPRPTSTTAGPRWSASNGAQVLTAAYAAIPSGSSARSRRRRHHPSCLDQPTRGGNHDGTVISQTFCLSKVDRRRGQDFIHEGTPLVGVCSLVCGQLVGVGRHPWRQVLRGMELVTHALTMVGRRSGALA